MAIHRDEVHEILPNSEFIKYEELNITTKIKATSLL